MISKMFFILSVVAATAVGLAGGYALQPTPAALICTDKPHVNRVLDIQNSPGAIWQQRNTDVIVQHESDHGGTVNTDADQQVDRNDHAIALSDQQRDALNEIVQKLSAQNVLLDDLGERIVLDQTDPANLHRQLGTFLQLHRSKVDEVLAIYSSMEDPIAKSHLRSLLGELNAPEVEQFAIDLTQSGDPATISEGVDLLAYMDVGNYSTREALFSLMEVMSDADITAAALRALRPQALPLESRQQIEQRIQAYAVSEHPGVRAAVIEQLSAWSGSNAVEQAVTNGLFDDSVEVRKAAIFAAGNSRVRSTPIRQRLLDIISDNNQPWYLREQSYYALQVYELEETEHQTVYQFHQQMVEQQENNNTQS